MPCALRPVGLTTRLGSVSKVGENFAAAREAVGRRLIKETLVISDKILRSR